MVSMKKIYQNKEKDNVLARVFGTIDAIYYEKCCKARGFTLSSWDKKYPNWRQEPVYFVRFERPVDVLTETDFYLGCENKEMFNGLRFVPPKVGELAFVAQDFREKFVESPNWEEIK